jgi:[acyl-carrier-protein] S-malonyltransferase
MIKDQGDTMDAFVFPGQGSQFIGMGKDLYDTFAVAREVFQEVDDALSQKLSTLMFGGDEKELMLTQNTQPALMAVSTAVVRVLEKEGGVIIAAPRAACVAGHSLGEYTALVAAGALSLRDAAQVLRIRGLAMQDAVPVGIGAMAALLGVDLETTEAIVTAAARGQVCDIANDNGGGQVVISGHADAIERALEEAKTRGVKRAVKLPVSAPFHSSLMAPAAKVMAEALSKIPLSPLNLPLIANVTAHEAKVEEVRDLLVSQVTGRVRWRETVEGFDARGVTRVVEVGAGKVLTGLARRIAPTLETVTLGTPADIDAYLG